MILEVSSADSHTAMLLPLQIGNMGFDPAVYRANIEAKAANLAHQKQKNWGSGQVMPDKEAPKDDSYEVGTIIETPKQTLLTGANPFKE